MKRHKLCLSFKVLIQQVILGWIKGTYYNRIFDSVLHIKSLWLKIGSAAANVAQRLTLLRFLNCTRCMAKIPWLSKQPTAKALPARDNTNTEKIQTCIHALSRIKSHNHNVWVQGTEQVLWQYGHSEQWLKITSLVTSVVITITNLMQNFTLIHPLYAKTCRRKQTSHSWQVQALHEINFHDGCHGQEHENKTSLYNICNSFWVLKQAASRCILV
jgi:hypothetical protein